MWSVLPKKKRQRKANIIRSGFTMQEVVEKLAQRGPRKIIDFVGRGGAAERVGFHACVEANDTELVTTIRVEQ